MIPIPFDGFTHEQLDELSERSDLSLCWCHHVAEPIVSNTYIICFECGHVWTKRALRKAWRKGYREMCGGWRAALQANYWRRAEKIFFCQVCIHDF